METTHENFESPQEKSGAPPGKSLEPLVEFNPRDVSQEVSWPNFFVVGAHKAGTTSLYFHLKRHPEVFLPSVKEPRYFTPEVRESLSLEQYRALYAGAAGYTAIGDITPFYLPKEGAAERIRKVCPGAKIVIMLRDPVERAYSHFLYEHRNADTESFRKALLEYEARPDRRGEPSQEFIEHGSYYGQVRRYLETFGSDSVLILLFENLARDPNQLLGEIARHIGVDPEFFVGRDFSEAHNVYFAPKSNAVSWAQSLKLTKHLPASLKLALRPFLFNMQKPPLDDESRRRLQELYDPDLTRLEELLGRKLPELRKTWR